MRFTSDPILLLPAQGSPSWIHADLLASARQDPNAPESNGPAGPQGGSGEPLPVTREQASGDNGSGDTSTEQNDKQNQQQGNPTDCLTDNLPLLIGFPLILYFLIIRPAQKQEKARKEMQATLGKGSKVVTTGGMHGTVVSIDDGTVTLKTHGDQRLTFDRSAIGRILDSGSGADSKDSN